MTRFQCAECETEFDNCLYWFDSLYYEKFEEREIKPFCGPKCVNEWHVKNKVNEWQIRKAPYPKGPQWQIIQNLYPAMFPWKN